MPYIGNPIYQSAFVTDQFSGDGTTTAFTMSVAPAGTSNVLVAVSGVLQDPSTYGVVGTTLNFTTAPPPGTGNISVRYLGVPVTGVTTTAYRTKTEFTATAGQTTFTPPSYTVGYIDVFLNGVLLASSDYTASNGTTVVLTTGAAAGNILTTESFYVSSVLNAIPNTTGSVSSSNIQTSVALTTPTMTSPTITGTGTYAGGVLNAYGVGLGTAVPSSGYGISFPATQSASSDANTLDDYEEGAWTPVVRSGSGTLGSYTSVGGYTKVGRLVSVWGYFNITSTGSASGEGQVTLPFAAASSTSYRNGCGSGREDNAIGFMTQFYNLAGGTRADLVTTAGNAITWTNGYGYLFSMQYPT
jgi:hypothetical protein